MKEPTHTAPADPDRINMNDAQEVAYWTEKLDVTKVKLKAAVNAAGSGVKEVETYLKKKYD